MSTVAQRLPADRRFEFSSDACPDDTFAVVRMSGVEAISKPYRFELVLVSDDAAIDFARLVGAGAQLRILAPDDLSRATPYAGMLAEFDQLHQAGGFTFYRALLVPRMWQLSLYRNSEVYLNEQTIPQIVEGLLAGARFSASRDYALKLTGAYRPHSYVCQYQETPLAFVSRWLEREGIYYHFEQADGIERLVLLDDKSAQPAQALAVNYRPADAFDVGLAPDSVQTFVCRSRMLPRTLVLQDYNHRRASVPLEVTAEVSASGLGEEMLYGENFRSEEEGQRYATIRAEELRCGARVFSGEATAVGLRSGHFMELSHHYREDFNGRYLVTEISHEGSQAGALLAGLKTPFNEGDRQPTSYRNSFVALPAATQFRPARSTPKPRVSGTMNATIDAEGSGEYAELDEHGQYKVQIPFDRTEKGAAKGSRPMRMASPYAGSDHGMHFPLHKGAEVLLSFIDGDPDRPVILGAVPNSDNPSVVDSRNPRLSMIHTKGGNQVGFDDTKGQGSVWMHSANQESVLFMGAAAAAAAESPAPAPGSPPPPPPPPPPESGIVMATKGGSDKVTFGHDNVLSLGSKNQLSIGSESSVGVSFANKVTMGMSMAVNWSTDLKWNVGRSDGFASVSIEDAKSVTIKENAKTYAREAIVLSAGTGMTSVDARVLEADLAIIRGCVAMGTTLSIAASAAYASFVNAKGATLDPLTYKRTGITGWKGVAGAVAIPVAANLLIAGALQHWAKSLNTKLERLALSHIKLDSTGIAQTIMLAPVLPTDKATVESELSLRPGTGIELNAPEIRLDASTGNAGIEITAGGAITTTAPTVLLTSSAAGTTSIGFRNNDKIVELIAPGAALTLDHGDVIVRGDSVSIGYAQHLAVNPVYAVLQAQQTAAADAFSIAVQGWKDAVRARNEAIGASAKLLGEPAVLAAKSAMLAASKVQNAISSQLSATPPVLGIPMLNGLMIDDQKSELSFLASSVKAQKDGIALTFGAASFKVDATGLSGDGALIKLG